MILDIWGAKLSRFHLQAFVNTATKFQISCEQGVGLRPEKKGLLAERNILELVIQQLL